MQQQHEQATTDPIDQQLARLRRATDGVTASAGFSSRLTARLALERQRIEKTWVDVLPSLAWRLLPVAAAAALIALTVARVSTTQADTVVAQAAPVEVTTW